MEAMANKLRASIKEKKRPPFWWLITMIEEKRELKNQRGGENRSPLSKKRFISLVIGFILTGLISSLWCARYVLTGAGPWILILTLGGAYLIYIIPEILMGITLINKSKLLIIVSIIINIIYLFIFNGLFQRPLVYDDEGGIQYHYAFTLRSVSLSCLIISTALGIILLILLNRSKWSRKKNWVALWATVIISYGLIEGIGMITTTQRQSTLVMMKKQYAKNRRLYENDQLSGLSSYVTGIKTAKFAVIPTSKITLNSTDVCRDDRDVQNLQSNVVLIEINGKSLSSYDYDYLTGDASEHEPFSKRQELAAKYNLTMRQHEKKNHQAEKHIKKTEIHWTKKQIYKYQGIGN
ncbi:hypothetical protein [Ligilactobacillus hohenheimensis]|uniref:hypothetical protein n=1 Tax=Ligilactobacillus hohenheimensis TaxID=2991832 RepID=UPI0024BB033A|nr:hypothetical protein [Ligilactobacillus hohenheimensis]